MHIFLNIAIVENISFDMISYKEILTFYKKIYIFEGYLRNIFVMRKNFVIYVIYSHEGLINSHINSEYTYHIKYS